MFTGNFSVLQPFDNGPAPADSSSVVVLIEPAYN